MRVSVSFSALRRVEALEKRRAVQRCIGGWPPIADDLDAWEQEAMASQDALRRSDEPDYSPIRVVVPVSGGGLDDVSHKYKM